MEAFEDKSIILYLNRFALQASVCSKMFNFSIQNEKFFLRYVMIHLIHQIFDCLANDSIAIKI